MPNLIVTLKPEDGWDKKTIYAKLREKAAKERSIIEQEKGFAREWDSQPIIKGDVDELTLTWRYKQYPKT